MGKIRPRSIALALLLALTVAISVGAHAANRPAPRPTKVGPTPTPPPPPPPPPAGEITSKATGNWATTATWSCNCIPAATQAVRILAGHTVTMSGTGNAATITVEGVLKASRTATSTLTVSGNLVVKGAGWLDYGTAASPVPTTVSARIRWILDESRYVGGHAMTPLASDVGLWVINSGRVTTKGPDRGGWSTLIATAGPGSSTLQVDPKFSAGWRVGDEVVVAPANTPINSTTPVEDERRTITTDLGGGKFIVNAGMTYNHPVQVVTWKDPAGEEWSEMLAPAVANLTRNVIFEAASPLHRPHVIFLEQAKAELSDLVVFGFSPIPRNIGTYSTGKLIPFGRYALHFHMQKDSSRGSYLRAVVIRDGMGDALHLHDSYGVVVEDLVSYNQARAPLYGGVPGTRAINLEEALDGQGNRLPDSGANDAWIDRPLVINWGIHTDTRSSGVWMGGGVGAYVVGLHAAGGRGTSASGAFWCEGCGNGNSPASATNPDRTPRVLRAVTSSSTQGFFWWQNSTPTQDVLDLLAWNNIRGLNIGAYHTHYWLYGVRAIGNRELQIEHHATATQISGFLADGQNKGGLGVRVDPYLNDATVDSRYENGVIRNAAVGVTFADCLQQRTCGSSITHVQFNRVEFTGDPLIKYVWHPQIVTTLKFRSQTGLTRATNFTLYRKDRVLPGVVYDPSYDAARVNNDIAGSFTAMPSVRMVWGSSYSGCAADDAVAAAVVTLCAETDAPVVAFYQSGRLIGTVSSSDGFAQATFDMRTWGPRRGYFYAKGIGANGRHNYSRVFRVSKY